MEDIVIKTPHFTLNATVKGILSEVLFSDLNYARSNFKIQYGQMEFESSGSPEYRSDKKIFLPGSSVNLDQRKIVLPTRLVKCIAQWVDGKKIGFTQSVKEQEAIKKLGARLLVSGCYTFGYCHNRSSCKESACYFVVKSKEKEEHMLLCLGLKLTPVVIKKLYALIRKLPEEAQIKFITEDVFTTIKLNPWWQDFYRIGWLLNKVRELDGRRSCAAYISKYYKNRSEDFLNGKHTLSQGALNYWTGHSNWETHTLAHANYAFDLP